MMKSNQKMKVQRTRGPMGELDMKPVPGHNSPKSSGSVKRGPGAIGMKVFGLPLKGGSFSWPEASFG
jgi:hypothetical protein